ncbi:MAG: hypothetical protein WC076_13540, partial [Terrimicrobiaceae bacterium]
QLKNNQPTAFGAAGKIAASASPFHPLQKREPQRQSRHTERALIALKARLVPERSWPFIRELSSMKISLPYNMICKNLFK